MTWQAKVTPAMRKEMRTLWPEFTMRQIAARYGVSARTVWTMLRGVACQRRKMDDQEVLDMRAAYPAMTLKQIATQWGYSYSAVRAAVSGKRYGHLPGAKETPNRGRDIAGDMARIRANRKVNVQATLLLHRL